MLVKILIISSLLQVASIILFALSMECCLYLFSCLKYSLCNFVRLILYVLHVSFCKKQAVTSNHHNSSLQFLGMVLDFYTRWQWVLNIAWKMRKIISGKLPPLTSYALRERIFVLWVDFDVILDLCMLNLFICELKAEVLFKCLIAFNNA